MSLIGTAFNVTLAAAASYTVPTGKTALFTVRNLGTSGTTTQIQINGNLAGVFGSASAVLEMKSFTANAGDVILNVAGGGSIALGGLLY